MENMEKTIKLSRGEEMYDLNWQGQKAEKVFRDSSPEDIRVMVSKMVEDIEKESGHDEDNKPSKERMISLINELTKLYQEKK